MPTIKQYGLLTTPERSAKDWVFGGLTGLQGIPLRSDGDWSLFLPKPEYQRAASFDSFACVTFSALNCIETLSRFLVQDWNKSDRFTAKMSGTTHKGNYLNLVAESIRLQGMVNEEDWPFDRADKNLTWEEFYKDIPEAVKAFGQGLLKDWDINWHWVDMADIREALKYGPLQVGVYAWPKPEQNGYFTDSGHTTRNHAVMLYNATDEYYEIFDHYDNVKKKLVPDYQFHFALQYFLTPKQPMPISIPNNTLVMQTGDGATGEAALHLDGKLYVDDLAKVLFQWEMRNNGDTKDKTKTLTKEQWATFPKYNFKNQKI